MSMTVRELQAVLDEIPGDAIVMLKLPFTDKVQFGKKRDGTPDMRRAEWGDIYNTREIEKAYRCNDDRYEQNHTVVIEIGEEGP